MSNYRIDMSALKFSGEKAESRLGRAGRVLGEKVVTRLLAFALFLLGAERQAIGASLGLPLGTMLSLLTKINRLGLPAFEDRRSRRSEFLPIAEPRVVEPTVTVEKDRILIDPGMGRALEVPLRDKLQVRVLVLNLVSNGVLNSQVAGEVLECTTAHVRTLCREMEERGADALLDQRRGQRRDYKITPEVKSELILQTAAHALTGKSTSCTAVTQSLNKRMGWQLADRTVRMHMNKLGLAEIAAALPALVEGLKKNSAASS